MDNYNNDTELVALLPSGDWELFHEGNDLEIYEVDSELIREKINHGPTKLYKEDLPPRPVMRVAEALNGATISSPIPREEPQFAVQVKLTAAEFTAMQAAGREPQLIWWNDAAQGTLSSDLNRMMLAAVQTVDDRYEELVPWDADATAPPDVSLPEHYEMLKAFSEQFRHPPALRRLVERPPRGDGAIARPLPHSATGGRDRAPHQRQAGSGVIAVGRVT